MKKNKQNKAQPSPQKLSELPRFFKNAFNAFISEQKFISRKFDYVINDAVFYIPYIITVIFALFLFRLTNYKHQLGNYGVEELFFTQIMPAVENLKSNPGIILKYKMEGPLYPLLLYWSGNLFSASLFTTGLYLNVLMASAALLFIYSAVKRAFNVGTALLVILVLSTNKGFVEFTYTASSGMLFMFLCAGALVFFIKGSLSDTLKGRTIWWSMAGLFSGLCALTYFMGLGILISFIVSFFIEKAFKKRNIIAIACSIFSAVSIPGIWSVYTFKKKTAILDLSIFDHVRHLATGEAVTYYFKNLYSHFFKDIDQLIGWPVGILIILGLIGLVLFGYSKLQWIYLNFGIWVFLMNGFFEYNRLYSLALLGTYFALGVYFFGSGHHKKIVHPAAAKILMVVFIVLIFRNVWISSDYIGKNVGNEPIYLKGIVDYIKKYGSYKESGLMAAQSLVPALSGVPHIAMPETCSTVHELLEHAERNKAMLFLYSIQEAVKFPKLRFLGNMGVFPLGMNVLAYNKQAALYAFDFEKAKEDFRPNQRSMFDYYHRLGKTIRADTDSANRTEISDFIRKKVRFNLDDFSQPKIQVANQFSTGEYTVQNLLFATYPNVFAAANLYIPETQDTLLEKSRFPAVVMCGGNQKEGKAHTFCAYLANALAQHGYAVLVYDNFGTGERTFPGNSHLAAGFIINGIDYSGAEPFMFECRRALDLVYNLKAVDTANISLAGIFEGVWPSLYLSYLDNRIKSLALIGDIKPINDYIMNNEIVMQNLIPGIFAQYSFNNLLEKTERPVFHPDIKKILQADNFAKEFILWLNQSAAPGDSTAIKDTIPMLLPAKELEKILNPAGPDQLGRISYSLIDVGYSLASGYIKNDLPGIQSDKELEIKIKDELQPYKKSGVTLNKSDKQGSVAKSYFTFTADNDLKLDFTLQENREFKADKTALIIPSNTDSLLNMELELELLKRGYTIINAPLRGRSGNYYDPVLLVYKSDLMGEPFVYQCTRDLTGMFDYLNGIKTVTRLEVFALDPAGCLAAVYFSFANSIKPDKVYLGNYVNVEGLLANGIPLPGADMSENIYNLNYYKDLIFNFTGINPFYHVRIINSSRAEFYFGFNFTRRLDVLNPENMRMDKWDNWNYKEKVRGFFASYDDIGSENTN
ncbi:MAG: hypothetical protein ABIA63_03280 [bacterium]